MRLALYITMLISWFAVSPVGAQEAPDFERDVLGAYETSPTRTWLDATYPDVRARLEAAASSRDNLIYVRQRAITLMSRYPDARTRGFLLGMFEDVDPEIRKMAVYTLGRALGRQADALLVAQLARVIDRDDPLVAQWAVRALRWVYHDDAVRLLRSVAGSDEQLAPLARAALAESVMLTPTKQ